MLKEKIAKLAAFLSENSDGHEIHALSVLDDAAKEVVLVVTRESSRKGDYAIVADPDGGVKVAIPVFTREQFKRQLMARGKGGTLAEGDWTGVAGLDMARGFARLAEVEYDDAMGRGFEFRNIVTALEEAGGVRPKD